MSTIQTTPEQKIQELQLALSKFSHEIRNPVTLIHSELQLLLSTHPEISMYKEWEDILDNVEYVKELLKELSDYNNAGRIQLTRTELKSYLHRIASAVRPSMEYLEINFKEEIAEDLPELPIDPVKLRQALFNLLRNAQEAVNGPLGKILFRAETVPEKKLIAITIQDNGCGMTPEQQEKIFSPFVTYKKNGTGLGLAITRQIIEAHNGTLTVMSSPDQGSTFTLFLG
ncbi:MAG TPA: sensor histidine kinase [Candidatus Blautia faecavium]|uniref:histidine kinase n=1 Tax=Candidatus Blautia faecavium TaxID=2838487 RepID=A0A9D2RVV4_9FIRM|nr:sensor histidine kinase [Candidatus Blautia faecavium]